MTDKSKRILLLLLVAVSTLIGFRLGGLHQCHRMRPNGAINAKVDTLIVRDTITFLKPISVTKRVVERELVRVTDTIDVHDTLYVYLDREQIQWRDSLCEVYASGINPRVDSVRHYRESKIITIETQTPVKVKDNWGVGLQAGYGASKDGLSPYIGIGLTYNILSW